MKPSLGSIPYSTFHTSPRQTTSQPLNTGRESRVVQDFLALHFAPPIKQASVAKEVSTAFPINTLSACFRRRVCSASFAGCAVVIRTTAVPDRSRIRRSASCTIFANFFVSPRRDSHTKNAHRFLLPPPPLVPAQDRGALAHIVVSKAAYFNSGSVR